MDVYVADGLSSREYKFNNSYYARVFDWMGVYTNYVDHPLKSDVVLFTGGADIHPGLYGQPKGAKTHGSLYRDVNDIKAFNIAMSGEVPIVGQCRGAQFITAMSGGVLYQDINNHNPDDHLIHLNHKPRGFGETIMCNSRHHQLMNPFMLPEDEYEIIAYADGLSDYYIGVGDQQAVAPPVEPEIVYYKKFNALAIQGHPEDLDYAHPYASYCRRLLKEYLGL